MTILRRILFLIISLGVLYYVLGFIAVQMGWMVADTYNLYSTVVGGVVSFCGLIAFGLPKLTTKDVEELEIESLQRVTKVAEEINQKKSELDLKADEITKLDEQRREMEFLIRKASLSLFLQDQIERSEHRIIEIIEDDKELSRLLKELKTNQEKLSILDQEIKSSEQVELLQEIIRKAREDKDQYSGLVLPLIGVDFPIGLIMNHIAKALKSISYAESLRNFGKRKDKRKKKK